MDGRFLALFSQISGQLGQIVTAFHTHNTLNEKNINLSMQILDQDNTGTEKKELPDKSILDSCLKEIIDSRATLEKVQTEMQDYKARVEKLEQYISNMKSDGCDIPSHHQQVCCSDDKKYLCGCEVKVENKENTEQSEIVSPVVPVSSVDHTVAEAVVVVPSGV